MRSLHPYYETAAARQRQEFVEEISAFLEKAARQAAKLVGRRVLEISQ